MTSNSLRWLLNYVMGLARSSVSFVVLAVLFMPGTAIEVQLPSATVTGNSLNVPFGGSSLSQQRVQSIYLASEIGTTGKIRSLTVTLASLPNFTMNNFTIRMKHSTLASFASALWDTGFTTVFSGPVTISSTGAYTFVFTTPFTYTGGSNNLIVDMSWQNGSANSMAGSISYTNTTSGGNRSLYYRDSGAAAGTPTSWSGATPTPVSGVWVPNIYLGLSPRLYVRTAATGRGNGTDWTNALGSLTSALSNSSSGDEIWVASGTYKPGVTRANTFQLKSDVSVYGGFNGNEISVSQRTMSNQTVLSGDIGTLGNFTDNCYHVVTGATGGVIDGFVIRDGFANTTSGVNSGGGGVLCYGTSPTIRNCVFTSNNAYYAGGAIYIANTATATIENCVFASNGGVGGITCQFGGAIEDEGGQSPIIRNCTFFNNVGTNGGAIEIVTAIGITSVINCVLWGNDSAGPEFYNGGKSVIFSGNTIKNGVAQFTQPSGVSSDGGSNDAIDPQFFNAGDPDGLDNLFGTSDDGLTLMPLSSAIDGGVSGGLSTDIVGRSRPAGGTPDRGAYETPVIYVNALATGLGNGVDWNNAYTQLSDAMSGAPAGPMELWVRAASYKPTAGNDRGSSFALRKGMGLYGGFGGIETSRSQRDWRMRATTLSGDIGTIGAPGDNSYHVLTTTSGPSVLDGFLVRDGVANQASPNDRGGGLYQTASLDVRRCLFVANSATFGGGLFTSSGAISLNECQFLLNSATSHCGGLFLNGLTAATVSNSVFWKNSATGGSYGGGGLFIEGSSNVTLINCTIANNTANTGGGGIQALGTSPTVRNSVLWGNTTLGSANQISTSTGTTTLQECLVQGGLPANSVVVGGVLQSADPMFLDDTSPLGSDNIPGTGDDGLTLRLSSPAINEGITTGVTATDLCGNIRQIDLVVDLGAYERLNVLFVDTDASGANNGSSWANAYPLLTSALTNAASGRDEIWVAEGTYYPSAMGDRSKSFLLVPQVGVYGGFGGGETVLSQRSLATRRVILSGDVDFNPLLNGNSAHVLIGANAAIIDGLTVADGYGDGSQAVNWNDSAGGLLDDGTSTTVINCIFSGNYASFVGGGILSYGTSMTQIRGSLFKGNQAGYGGAFFVYYASIGVANVTCSGNSASSFGGSTYIYSGQATIGNTVLWGDSLPALYNNTSLVWIAGSNIQSSGGSGASWDFTLGVDQGNNLDAEPKFVKESDPAGADALLGTDDDGLRLYAGSPCIDSGVRAGGPTLDLLGASRPAGSAPDQGCYEGKMVTVDFLASTSSGIESVTAPTITVRLSEASDLPVTVTYARATGGSGGTASLTSDFALGLLTLTFNAGETTKALNLTVVDDLIEEVPETIGFVLTGAKNARISGTTLHTYTILNNDTAGIATSPTVISINESGAPTSATFTLSLTSTPANSASVSVVVTSSAPTEALLTYGAAVNQSPVTVTWSSGDYGPKTVTVASVDDLIDDGNFTLAVTIAPATSTPALADTFYPGKDAADVQVTVVDNDEVGLILSKTAVAVTELGTTTDSFTVKLRSQPTGTVTVLVSSSNTADATVSVSSLTFGTNRFLANGWDVAQTVTVTAINDLVDEPGTNSVAFAINLDANSGADLKYDSVSASVSGTLTDNDSAGVTVTPILTQTPSENGGTINYSVVLDSKPTAPVTIGNLGNLIRSSNTLEGTVSVTTLTFGINNGSGGWDTPQTVTVTAVDDSIVATNPTYQAIFPAPSSSDAKYNVLLSKSRDLQNTDDDTAGILFSPTGGLVTTELGGTATFTARLRSRPAGGNSVTFTITALQSAVATFAYQGQISVDGGTTYAANGAPCTLTFTDADGLVASPSGTSVTAGWNTPVTVTIRGLDDGFPRPDQSYFISRAAASSSDAGYSGLFASTTAVSVTNQSKDAAGLTVNPTALSVTEALGTNHSATFSLKLAKQPTGTVNVALSFLTNAAQAILSTSALSFSTSTGTEGGWDVVQNITVTTTDDGIDDGDLTTNIGFAVSSADMTYNGLSVPVLPVLCIDDDSRGIVVAPVSGLSTTEAGGQAIFVVYLASQPTASGTVTIGLRSLDTSEGLIRQGVSGAAATTVSLSFNDTNWNIPKIVSIVGQDDAVDDGDVSYLIDFETYSATASDYNTSAPALPNSVSVVNQDDDTARVLLSKTTMALGEDPTPSGMLIHSDTYTIVLGSQPTNDVVVALDPGSKATLSTNTITFTTANWSSPVTVTVTAVDDVVAEGLHQALVTHTVSSVSDGVYHGLSADTLIATITDDDTAGVTAAASPSTLTTVETVGGTPDEIAYTLDTQPRGNVTILLTSSNPDEAIPVPDRLTFTPTDYNSPSAHTVQIRGVDDDVADGNQTFSIIATAISADTVYNSIAIPDVDGSNQDDDVVGVVFTATSAMAPLTTSETGSAVTFTVRLSSQPLANVTVPLSSSDTDEGTVAATQPLILTFNSSNWDVDQIVTVTGQRDYVDESTTTTAYTIAIGPSAGANSGYQGTVRYNGNVAANGVVYLANTDIDQAGVLITPSTGLVTSESGATASYSIVLTSKPSGTVRVNINPGSPPQLAAIAFVDFTPADWSIPQVITVSAVNDDIAEGTVGTPHTGELDHTLTTADTTYQALGVLTSVTALITDDDTPAIVLNQIDPSDTHENPLDPQAISTFAINLQSEPTSMVRITVTSSDPTEVRLSTDGIRANATTSVTVDILAANWDSLTPPVITAFGVNDDVDDGNQVVNVTLAVVDVATTDTRYDAVSDVIYQITNHDKDTSNVTIAESTHGLNFPLLPSDLSENFLATVYTYTLVLDSEPTGNVTINLSETGQVLIDTDQLTVGNQTSVVFTATKDQAASGNTAGWNVPLTVSVAVVDDLNAETSPHSASIVHVASGGGYTGVTVANVTVSIADNDSSTPPVVTLPSPNPFPYNETGHLARVIDSGATVGDVDSPNFNTGNVTLSFTAGNVPGEDELGVANVGVGQGEIGVTNTTITYNPIANTGAVQIGTIISPGTSGTPLVITLAAVVPADVSLEAVQALLRQLTYRNVSLNPTLAARAISLTVNDGDGGTSTAVTKNITITPYDDPPTFAAQSIITVVDQTIAGTLTATDPEELPLTFTKLTDPDTGTVTVNANGDYSYVPSNGDFANTYTFTVRVADAALNTTTATITIHITGGDETRPQLLSTAPLETELGERFAELTFDPSTTSGSPLTFRVVDQSTADITFTVTPLSNSPTSVTARVRWEIIAGVPITGNHFTLGIIVTDPSNNAASYIPVTLQLVSPNGPG